MSTFSSKEVMIARYLTRVISTTVSAAAKLERAKHALVWLGEWMDDRRFTKVLSRNRALGEERVIASLKRHGSGQARPCRIASYNEAILERHAKL